MFTDVRSSTELRTTVGDEEAHRRLRTVQDVIVASVEENHGQVVKGLGDGILASFGSPRQAIYCAVQIQQGVNNLTLSGRGEPVAVRIGINTGEVVREDDDLFGEAVNAAARISALAEGGETLIASVVKDLAGTVRDVGFEDRGTHPLKGFPEEWRLFSVRSTAAPALLLEKTPFVGRRSELEQLEHHLERAVRGKGSVVMIGGEPGVGKTRLAEELAEEAKRRGAIVFTGSCYDVETAVPFAPFVEILEATARSIPKDVFREIIGDSGPELARFFPELKAMFPDIPNPVELPAEQERRYTFNSIGRYLARSASARPVMLLLDDLQWGEEATLDLLQYLSSFIEDQSALIVGTYRDVELAVGRPLARVLEQMVRHRRAHRISLKRFARDDVAVLLQRLAGSDPPAGLVEAIYSETDGNAFFVEEVFRHLLEEGRLLDASGSWREDLDLKEVDVPESVRLVTGRRIERLDDVTVEVLTYAAVAGRVFEISLLQKTETWDATAVLDALDEAERARLIEALPSTREPRYQFVHELVRQTLLADISLPRRQRLHLAIGQAIETLPGFEEKVAELAHHLYQAGAAADTETTIRYLTAAGDRAHRTGGSEESLRAYERAFSLVETDDVSKADLLFKMGRSLRGLQRFDEAMKVWEKALAIYEREGDAARLARVCRVMADRYNWIGAWKDAVDILERGLRVDSIDSRSRGLLLALQGVAHSWLGEHETGLDRIEAAERIGSEPEDPLVYWTARSARAVYHWCFNDHKACVDVGSEVIEALRGASAPWALATVLAFVQFSLVLLGRWKEAEDMAVELTELADHIGHPSAKLFVTRWTETFALARNGDARRQIQAAERDRVNSESFQMPWVAESFAWGALAHSWLGEEAEALRLARKGVEVAPEGAFSGTHRGVLAVCLAFNGERQEVTKMCRAAETRLAEGRVHTLGQATEMFFLAEALVILGDGEGLARIHDDVETFAGQMRWRAFDPLPTTLFLSSCKLARGDQIGARALFEDAVHEAERNGAVARLPQILTLRGKALADFGDREEARKIVERALAEAQRYDMVLFEQLARRTLDEVLT